MDWKKLGFKAGIEIHQQLNTKKLFCECPTGLCKWDPPMVVRRKLHAVASELGAYDPAALHEMYRDRVFNYEVFPETVCLVELDEEPPHPVNPEALHIALQASLLIGATPVEEVQVMRKTVVDGSNTAGFQRTMLVATSGKVETAEGAITLPYICLEEDAARIISREENKINYRLDRLGSPLLEFTTDPLITSPKQGEEVARQLGNILRSINVRRGLGTIRQDVNVSITGGTRIEIKGVQALELIPKIMEYEALRQVALIKIMKELSKLSKKPAPEALEKSAADVTGLLAKTESKVIKKSLEAGGKIVALKAPKFAGFLGRELCPGKRLGTEVADIVRAKTHLKGIFHTDELPGYGISETEVGKIRTALKCTKDDAFILVAGSEKKVQNACRHIAIRLSEAYDTIPKESRRAKPDGNSEFMRPLPGAARMYPETDIPPVPITAKNIMETTKGLPELVDAKLVRFKKSYRLPEQLAHSVIHEGFAGLFEKAVKELKLDPAIIADALTSELSALRRDGVDTDSLTNEQIFEVFGLLSKKKIAKEGLSDAFRAHAEGKAIRKKTISEKDLDKIVAKIVRDNKKLIGQDPSRAFQKLMGPVMKEVRGKIDGELVSKSLKKHLK